MQAFDPFKGIGDPADPYQTTFNKYITGQYFTKRNEMADAMFSGDVASFDKWVATTPEGRMWMSTNFTRPMDALAKENKGRVETVAKFLTEASELKWDLSPEEHRALQEYTTLIDDGGAPLPYADGEELLKKGRAAEQVISKVRFQQDYLKGFAEFAQQNPQSISFERPKGAGGKILMRVTDDKVFDDYIDAMAEQAVYGRMFDGSIDAAKTWLRKVIKDKYDVKASVFDPYESVERKEAAKAKAEGAGSGPRSEVSVVRTPQPDGSVSERVVISPWQVTGGKSHKVAKVALNTARGGNVDLYAPALTWDDKGLFYIEGVNLGVDDVKKIKEEIPNVQIGTGTETTSDDANIIIDFITARNLGKRERYAAANNGGEMNQLYGSKDPYEVIAMKLRERGENATAAEIRAAWKDPAVRKGITEILK